MCVLLTLTRTNPHFSLSLSHTHTHTHTHTQHAALISEADEYLACAAGTKGWPASGVKGVEHASLSVLDASIDRCVDVKKGISSQFV